VVVDDGVATGATMGAALRLIRAAGARGVLMAVPVAPETALAALAPLADGAICLESPEPFHAVGQAYRSFPQLDDSEVTAILARHRPRGPA
jgi:predicted phosphoribosyltransferase